MKQKYNIGDEVWYASFERRETRITCDDCQGQKYLTVIMGDGSQVTIDCVGCQSGYESPKGYNIIYEYKANSELRTINRIEIYPDKIEYGLSPNGYCGEEGVFGTREEADKKAHNLGRDYYLEQRQRLENLKENSRRTWSWNATYHRRQIKEAQRQLEYHTAKLNVAKVKAKEDK